VQINLNFKKNRNIFKKIQKHFGKSYYFATFFLPKEKKEATQILYAFFRIPDEIVDNPNFEDSKTIREKLLIWKEKWHKAYQSNKSDEIVLEATSNVFRKFSIPFELSISFLDAMITDLEKKRYQNFEELKKYMFGSAAAVGLMMCYIIGFKEDKALEYAQNLGYAMQLTNFLRDIKEDFEIRGRIYIPLEELTQFNITENDIKNHNLSNDFISLMKFQIQRARSLYKNANEGIKLLNKDGQFAVKMASVLYEKILDKIEEQKYDIFSKRAHTSFFEKVYILIKEIIRNEK